MLNTTKKIRNHELSGVKSRLSRFSRELLSGKNLIILIICACFIGIFHTSNTNATQYTWTGNVDTSWSVAGNWNPSGGPPGATDTVTIVTGSNNCHLVANTTIGKLTLTSGTLQMRSYTLTINTNAAFDGGTVYGTANNAVKPRGTKSKFAGTTFNAEVETIGGQIQLDGSTFNDTCYFEETGVSGSGAGGNTFNNISQFINNSSTTFFTLANTTGNTFNANVIFTNLGAQDFTVSNAGQTAFNGNVFVNSTNGNIRIGTTTGDTSRLASGKTITVGSVGFGTGTLLLRRFIQNGSTAQSITLTGTAILNLINARFNAKLTINSPSSVIKDSEFNDSLSVTQTNTSTNVNWNGGNTFSGITTITNTGTKILTLTLDTRNIYNTHVTFITTSTGIIRPFNKDSSDVKGNLTATGTKVELDAGTGIARFTGTNSQHISGSMVLDFKKIKIDKTSGTVTCDTTITVLDTLNLTRGNLVTTSSHLLTMKAGSKVLNASDNSFVSGPVKKIGSTAFTYPTGKGSSYRAIEISAPSNASDAFTAEYFNEKQLLGESWDTTLAYLSYCNYWNLTKNSGNSSVYIYLYWQSSNCGIGDTSILRIANWQTDTWKDLGHGTITGNYSSGKMKTPATNSTYGNFLLAYSEIPVIHTDIEPETLGTGWETVYNGTGPEKGLSVKKTIDGGFIVAGTIGSADTSDIILLKLDADGDTTWMQIFSGSDADEAFSVEQCSDTGYVIAGFTNSFGNGEKDFFLIKTDKDGRLETTKTFGSTLDEGSYAIRQSNDNGYIIAGYTASEGSGGKDVYVVKLDSILDEEWSETFGGDLDDIAYDVQQTADSGYIVCGSTVSFGDGMQAYVIKIDSIGNEEWSEYYGGSGTETANSIQQESDGSYIFAGNTNSYGMGGYDIWLVKTDTVGTIEWNRTHGGADDETASCVLLMADNGYLISGKTESYGSGGSDCYYLATDLNGEINASVTTGGANDDEIYETVAASDTSFVSTGYSIQGGGPVIIINTIFYCKRWYPRALQVNNLWCPSVCYPGLKNILVLTSNHNEEDKFIEYVYKNHYRHIIFSRMEDLMFEEVTQNNSAEDGDNLRARLHILISRLKNEARVENVVAVLRMRSDEETYPTPGISDNLDLLEEIKNFNSDGSIASQFQRFDEICIDYEYWLSEYGFNDSNPNPNPGTFPNIILGWTNFQDLTDEIIDVQNDVGGTFYIDTISAMYGHLDRDVEPGIPGNDESIVVDYLDDNFQRIYLFFFPLDRKDFLPLPLAACSVTTPHPDADPSLFLTYTLPGYQSNIERIKFFGANTDNSQIWPMFSAEDFENCNDWQIYLARWLSGTGPFLSEHYITEAQNIFHTQYINDLLPEIYLNDPGWVESLEIYGYSTLRYGLTQIYGFRTGDAKWNYDVCIPELRLAQNYFENTSHESIAESEIAITANEKAISYEIYDLTGRKVYSPFDNATLLKEFLPPGVYFIKKIYKLKSIIIKIIIQ